MKHLGDITKLNGAEIPVVEVITGGSPCQDLSIAGKRAGLAGERSGLFMEQIRIIKEMREHDRSTGRADDMVRPRYMVWENVPGAFNSNKGEDFRAVLEETARIADGNADVPQPPNGKWSNAGAIMGNGWSIAWRVHDAQFWGVPQRRRRISLVADFGGQSAPEILFERKGVPWDIAESRAEGQGITGDAENGVGATECYGIDAAIMTGGNCTAQGPCYYNNISATLKASAPHRVCAPVTFSGENVTSKANASNPKPGDPCHTLNQDNRNYVVAGFCQGASPAAQTIGYQEEVSPTIKGAPSGTTRERTAADAESGVGEAIGFDGYNQCLTGNIAQSIRANKSDGDHVGMVYIPPIARSLTARNDGSPCIDRGPEVVCYGICSYASNSMKSGNPHSGIYKADTSRTLDLNGGNPACNQGGICVVQCYDMTHATDVIRECGETAPTLQSRMGTGGNQVPLTFGIGNGQANQEFTLERTGALNCMHDQKAIATFQNTGRGWWNQSDVAECIRTPCGGDSTKANLASDGYAVRRLTPLECERLQGYPDGWTDISGASDSARYKALGNSIALPFWRWMLQRMSTYLPADATLGSLFDGIGGFPLIWEEIHGKGSARWASEIEPFPIAVTKSRFKEVSIRRSDDGLQGTD